MADREDDLRWDPAELDRIYLETLAEMQALLSLPFDDDAPPVAA